MSEATSLPTAMGNKNYSRKRRKSGPLRLKKKTFYGKKHTRQASDSTEDIVGDISTPQSSFVVEEMQTSASSRKLEESVSTSSSLPEIHGNNENPFHYIIIDSDIFKTILDVVGKCPTCHQKKLSYINNTACKFT